jgi:hypothetical protein
MCTQFFVLCGAQWSARCSCAAFMLQAVCALKPPVDHQLKDSQAQEAKTAYTRKQCDENAYLIHRIGDGTACSTECFTCAFTECSWRVRLFWLINVPIPIRAFTSRKQASHRFGPRHNGSLELFVAMLSTVFSIHKAAQLIGSECRTR